MRCIWNAHTCKVFWSLYLKPQLLKLPQTKNKKDSIILSLLDALGLELNLDETLCYARHGVKVIKLWREILAKATDNSKDPWITIKFLIVVDFFLYMRWLSPSLPQLSAILFIDVGTLFICILCSQFSYFWEEFQTNMVYIFSNRVKFYTLLWNFIHLRVQAPAGLGSNISNWRNFAQLSICIINTSLWIPRL